MAGYYDQYQQLIPPERIFKAAVELQCLRKSNIGQKLTVTTLLLQKRDVLRQITPESDVQAGTGQMNRQCSTPRTRSQNSNGFMLRNHRWQSVRGILCRCGGLLLLYLLHVQGIEIHRRQ